MATHTPVLIDELYGELILPEGDSRWVVIHTKPRCEKKLAEYARQNEITYYLPQFTASRIYQRRKVNSANVMFPGYLFVILDIPQRQTLSISGYVVSFIKVVDQRELLDDLLNLNKSKTKKADVLPGFWLSKGLEVEITAGAFKGTKGVVESHEKLSEVHLQVKMLHQAVLVKINPKDVKVLGEFEIVEV
jgi:transcription antitermination factor NusG